MSEYGQHPQKEITSTPADNRNEKWEGTRRPNQEQLVSLGSQTEYQNTAGAQALQAIKRVVAENYLKWSDSASKEDYHGASWSQFARNIIQDINSKVFAAPEAQTFLSDLKLSNSRINAETVLRHAIEEEVNSGVQDAYDALRTHPGNKPRK